jgi:hypothetical protein
MHLQHYIEKSWVLLTLLNEVRISETRSENKNRKPHVESIYCQISTHLRLFNTYSCSLIMWKTLLCIYFEEFMD